MTGHHRSKKSLISVLIFHQNTFQKQNSRMYDDVILYGTGCYKESDTGSCKEYSVVMTHATFFEKMNHF